MEDKPLLTWDECANSEGHIEYYMDMKPEELPDHLKGKSEKEIRDFVYADSDQNQWDWDDAMCYLTDLMNERNPGGYWTVKVENFGWMSRSGSKEFVATTGKELIKNILPNCDCTFHIYDNDGIGFKINNFHHDSPVGKEWYYVMPQPENN